MRIIKMADVMGAARDSSFGNAFGWKENWEGASSIQLDEMLEGAGLPQGIEQAENYAPLDQSPSVRRVVHLPVVASVQPAKPRKLLVSNRA
mgnify:CR=1 FL=1